MFLPNLLNGAVCHSVSSVFVFYHFCLPFLICLIWLQSQHWNGRHISRHHQKSRRLIGPKNSQPNTPKIHLNISWLILIMLAHEISWCIRSWDGSHLHADKENKEMHVDSGGTMGNCERKWDNAVTKQVFKWSARAALNSLSSAWGRNASRGGTGLRSESEDLLELVW